MAKCKALKGLAVKGLMHTPHRSRQLKDDTRLTVQGEFHSASAIYSSATAKLVNGGAAQTQAWLVIAA